MSNRYKSPDKKLNFFQNYIKHTESIIHNNKKVFDTESALEKFSNIKAFNDVIDIILELINNPLESKLNFKKPLYDFYDYTDEVLGAVVIPVSAMAASVALIAMTIKELFCLTINSLTLSIKGLFISESTNKEAKEEPNANKQDNNCALALLYTLGAIVSVLVAILSFIKCTISMITRPIATLVKGYNNSDEFRFGVPPENYDSSADVSENDDESTPNYGQ